MSRAAAGPAGGATTTLAGRARLLLLLVALLWIVEAVDQFALSGALDRHGIVPREARGLLGIVFAPFLHVGFGHLLSNTLPFFVLGFLVSLRGAATLFWVSVYAAVVGGLGVWTVGGARTVHVGSSILIFGWFGYLLVRGAVERTPSSALLALAVILLYGGLVFGVLPLRAGVSWQGHLFGALGGALAAWSLAWKPPGETAAGP